jgi:hypothetical protein
MTSAPPARGRCFEPIWQQSCNTISVPQQRRIEARPCIRHPCGGLAVEGVQLASQGLAHAEIAGPRAGGKKCCSRYRLGYKHSLRSRNQSPGGLLPWDRSLGCLYRRNGSDRRARSAMPTRSIRSWALSVFVCWLTLLASADDFNLARLALAPSAADSEGLLPMDDPNSDFTEPSQFRERPTTSRDRGACTLSIGQRLARATLTSPFAALTHGHPPRPAINAPLRC